MSCRSTLRRRPTTVGNQTGQIAGTDESNFFWTLSGAWHKGVSLSVLLQVRVGLVHGMNLCVHGTVEWMNLRPFMASNFGPNDVSNNIRSLALYFSSLEDGRGSNNWCNGSLTVAERVLDQPIYGALLSQTSADGRVFNIRHWSTKNGQHWVEMLPDFLHPVRLYMRWYFIFTCWHYSRVVHM